MKWASVLSREKTPRFAVVDAAERLSTALGEAPELVLAFLVPGLSDQADLVAELLAEQFPDAVVLGCSAGGVVGGGHEVERQAALSLTGAVLPGIDIHPFLVAPGESRGLAADPGRWPRRLGAELGEHACFVLVPDPFTCEVDPLISSLDAAYPEAVKIGGLASGGRSAGDNALFFGGEALRAGAAGLVLDGDLRVDTVVAQGCRPIGAPLFITRADENVICELDGRPATEALVELYGSLDEDDRELFRRALHLGVVMEEGRSEYGPGDFLVRNVIGLDPKAGVVAVAERVQRGQVVQFHLRDARTSAEDLDTLLGRYREGAGPTPPDAALLFSCLGRGEHLYGESDHDSNMIRRHLGPLPIGGFFCNGEIGPVGGRSFLHGYTSSIALLRSSA